MADRKPLDSGGTLSDPRLRREMKTVSAMIRLYCRDHHQTALHHCQACRELEEYAAARLASCPFQGQKTTCARCAVHCYKPSMRDRIMEVMRYAGPRMMIRHPILAAAHLVDGFRQPSEHPGRSLKNADVNGDDEP